jgi:hypothetical protein
MYSYLVNFTQNTLNGKQLYLFVWRLYHDTKDILGSEYEIS